MINDVVIECPDTRDFTEQKLIEKCNREEISIDEVIYFLVILKAKHFLKPTLLYIKASIYYSQV